MNSDAAVLISSRPLFSKTFTRLLQVLGPELHIHACSDDADTLSLLKATMPRLVIVDAGAVSSASSLPSAGSAEQATAIAEQEDRLMLQILTLLSVVPESGVVVVLDEQDDALTAACMEAGALGVLIKATPPQVLVQMLERVLEGEPCRPAPTTTIAREEVPEALRKQLSARQQKLLRLMLGGHSISASARQLGMTPAKVVTEMRRVLGTLRGREF